MNQPLDREAVAEPQNPLGIDGIEFIEFATSKPQAMGGVLETMGFRPIARHRSREVELYRQGTMNVIVNSQPADVPRTVQPVERPIISAFAIRVRDADAAFRRAQDLGAWAIPVARAGDGAQHPRDPRRGREPHLFRRPLRRLLDLRHRLPRHSRRSTRIRRRSPECSFFGVVQYIGADRTADWVEFYAQIFGFTPLPDSVRFGIMPKGLLLQSPCRKFYPAADRARRHRALRACGGAPAAHRPRDARREWQRSRRSASAASNSSLREGPSERARRTHEGRRSAA